MITDPALRPYPEYPFRPEGSPTTDPARAVLLLDGPLEGKWRKVAPGTSHAVLATAPDPSDPRGLRPFIAQYRILPVTVRVWSVERAVLVGVTGPRDDLDALAIRWLFTEQAASALLGFEVAP
jgi:hypothetical protein